MGQWLQKCLATQFCQLCNCSECTTPQVVVNPSVVVKWSDKEATNRETNSSNNHQKCYAKSCSEMPQESKRLTTKLLTNLLLPLSYTLSVTNTESIYTLKVNWSRNLAFWRCYIHPIQQEVVPTSWQGQIQVMHRLALFPQGVQQPQVGKSVGAGGLTWPHLYGLLKSRSESTHLPHPAVEGEAAKVPGSQGWPEPDHSTNPLQHNLPHWGHPWKSIMKSSRDCLVV